MMAVLKQNGKDMEKNSIDKFLTYLYLSYLTT